MSTTQKNKMQSNSKNFKGKIGEKTSEDNKGNDIGPNLYKKHSLKTRSEV